ncbi:DHA2 family efflux MFS transporter permease subunit [Paracoccus sp. S1E-3]|uniref:DHA2 family efflux MFS transporter permease subunit n=1 Tax=Paracoccus sp. S1E-3 TaxID=2756130 RepID=UPI0015EE950B|nr:DHA2 family efflux MFS transporter permease subunit [Paracoccus sp. S1E-3]MBA4489273.1 DHA2 family efflux MFS transporter permease subunit [Paracoccus sp. S1E-3]
MSATTATAAPPAIKLPDLRALIGVGAVLLGTLTSLLNSRLTDIGLADIRGALGVGMDEASWLTTAYVVAEVAAIPSAVWLRSILSPARGVLIGSLIFTMASFLAPFSPNLQVLIAIQAIRGLSAGILMPMAYAVVMRHMPQPLRIYALSFYALVSSLTPAVAASIEGWIMFHLSWEYLFWINVIPGSLTLLAGAYGLANDPIKFLRFRRHDGFGLLALSLGLAALVTALDQGNRLDWFGSGLIVGLLAAAGFLLAAYLIHALRHNDPVVSPRLLARDNIGLSLLVMFVMRIGLMSSAYLIPQYLIRVQGFRALESGTMFWVSALPQIILTPFVAWLIYRLDPRNLVAFGLLLFGAGTLMLTDLTHLWTGAQFLPALLVQSVAAPFIAVPLMVLMTEEITVREIPWIASLVHITRTVSSALGLALVATFTRKQEQLHSALLGLHVESGSAMVQGRIDATASTLEAQAVDPVLATGRATAMLAGTVQREAFVLAYADMFLVLGVTLVLTSLATLFMYRPKLPGKFL